MARCGFIHFIIPALGRKRQSKLEVCLGYIINSRIVRLHNETLPQKRKNMYGGRL